MKQLENLWFCTAPDPNIKFAPRPPRFPTKFWPKRPRWKLTRWELEVVTCFAPMGSGRKRIFRSGPISDKMSGQSL